jgi:hypothetical protein
LKGSHRPQVPEVFEIIEEDREQFYQETVALRALLRRTRGWESHISALEARVADLTAQLTEAGVPIRDMPSPQEVGSPDPPDNPEERQGA